MTQTGSKRSALWIGLVLVLGTVGLYWPAAHFEFINLDDPTYVLQNPKVSQGVTGHGVRWAFTAFYGANWHPLTWISHMVDVSLFGFAPMGHHLVNVGIHAVNALLLFLLLRQLTGDQWRSALVAGLFAWHPTHVESVAWVAERKDVLAMFFGLLTLMAYGRYAKSKVERRGATIPATPHPTLSPTGAERAEKVWYGAALGLFACGLMSKPMLVTWPFVMLLLDFWPLRRIEPSTFNLQLETLRNLFVEKIPFFALTVGSCVLTFFAQRAGGAVQSMEALPWGLRMENALVSYARYLGKTFWPAELSAYYPHPLQWPNSVVMGAAGLVGALLVLAIWRGRTQRFWLTSVGWFLGTLVPVIGLIQVGGQSIADRYLYIPQVGIWIAVVWAGAELIRDRQRLQTVAMAAGGLFLLANAAVTRQYLPKWRNSIALYQHALSVEPRNPPALFSLGLALSSEGKLEEALPYLEKAAALDPNIQVYQGQLALAYELQGNTAEAIARYRRCLELSPDLTEALNNLAWLLATDPQAEHRNGADAVRFATRACELTQYDWPMFLGTLAASYAEAGRFPEAIATAEKAEQMARKRGFTELADRNAELLKEYRAGRAHREPDLRLEPKKP